MYNLAHDDIVNIERKMDTMYMILELGECDHPEEFQRWENSDCEQHRCMVCEELID